MRFSLILVLLLSGCAPKAEVVSDVALYIPNRIFDVLDIFRARVRVGPGAAVSIRATEYVDLNLGAYASVYVGLPGPRQKPVIPLPAFLETLAVAELSVIGVSADGGFGPEYSKSEFGLGLHVALLGIDLGIDPVEFVDLLLGILTIDIRKDDF